MRHSWVVTRSGRRPDGTLRPLLWTCSRCGLIKARGLGNTTTYSHGGALAGPCEVDNGP